MMVSLAKTLLPMPYLPPILFKWRSNSGPLTFEPFIATGFPLLNLIEIFLFF